MTFTIYGLINSQGRLCYIGQTRDLEKRLKQHRSRKDADIKEAVVLGTAASQELADRMEQVFIEEHGGKSELLNRTNGGHYGYTARTPAGAKRLSEYDLWKRAKQRKAKEEQFEARLRKEKLDARARKLAKGDRRGAAFYLRYPGMLPEKQWEKMKERNERKEKERADNGQ